MNSRRQRKRGMVERRQMAHFDGKQQTNGFHDVVFFSGEVWCRRKIVIYQRK